MIQEYGQPLGEQSAWPRVRLGRPGRTQAESFALSLTSGFGVVGPLLAAWEVGIGLSQLGDLRVASRNPAVTATVVSAAPVSTGRSTGASRDLVLAFPAGPAADPCRVTVRVGPDAAGMVPGQSLTVVPRADACAPPVIPSQIGSVGQTFLLAALLLAGGLASLRVWGVLWGSAARP